jgi:hypothetical protein
MRQQKTRCGLSAGKRCSRALLSNKGRPHGIAVGAKLGDDGAAAHRRRVARQAEHDALPPAFDARANGLVGDRAQARQHLETDGAPAGRGDDRRLRRNLDRLAGIAMELGDGAETAAGPRGVRIADVVDEQVPQHGSVLQASHRRWTAQRQGSGHARTW